MNGDEHRPKVTRSWMIRQGQEIAIDRLDLELTPLDLGERSVFASAHTNTKVLGLSPGQSDLQLILEWEGQLYEIAEATVFDLELHVSGETTVQVTGKLRPVKSREGSTSAP